MGNGCAIAERQMAGKIKLVTDRKGRMLGVDIVCAYAGELILQRQALEEENFGNDFGYRAYPTDQKCLNESPRQYFTPALFSNRIRTVVRLLVRLP